MVETESEKPKSEYELREAADNFYLTILLISLVAAFCAAAIFCCVYRCYKDHVRQQTIATLHENWESRKQHYGEQVRQTTGAGDKTHVVLADEQLLKKAVEDGQIAIGQKVTNNLSHREEEVKTNTYQGQRLRNEDLFKDISTLGKRVVN